MESLLLSRRALSSPTTCRFIPAHPVPWFVPMGSVQGVTDVVCLDAYYSANTRGPISHAKMASGRPGCSELGACGFS